MAHVFITGSTDGLGLAAARLLVEQGHRVVGHARNDTRARNLRAALPEVADVVVGDLSGARQTREVAAAANAVGRFDAVITTSGSGTANRAGSPPQKVTRTCSRSTSSPRTC